MTFSKWYVFAFMLIFYLLVFVIRSYLLWRETGINPLVKAKEDDIHSFNIRLFKVISILILAVTFLYSFGGSLYLYLLPIEYLERPLIKIAGWCLLHLSLAWIFLAQLQMAHSWRIGIDREHKAELVTKGVFGWSRNPIFLGILAADFGFFLVLPNAVTLLIFGISLVSVCTQVRLEESFLLEQFGEAYRDYRQRVRRWM